MHLLLCVGVTLLVSSSIEAKATKQEGANELQPHESVSTVNNTTPSPIGIRKLHFAIINNCFPSDSFVRNNAGDIIQMKDLKIGDKVLTMDKIGNPTYSEVIMMLHRDHSRTIDDYVRINTKDGARLTISTHHLLPVSTSRFIYSKDVRPGHEVTIYNETEKRFSASEVTSVELVTKTGLHAPLSMEGTIVVNDVYASCYASFPSQTIAHAGFSLWRIMYTYFSSLLDLSTQSAGLHWYPRMLMSVTGY